MKVAKTAPVVASVARKHGLKAPLKSAEAAPLAPEMKRSTRPPAASATSRRPRRSKASACGLLSELRTAVTVLSSAESCRTWPEPASATKILPFTSTATPAGVKKWLGASGRAKPVTTGPPAGYGTRKM